MCNKLVAGLAATLLIVFNTHAASGPNIVYIMADDLGIGDVNCYAEDRCQIDTPHMDALAARGMRFTDAHTASTICAPVRRAIMTGRYSWRFQPTRPNGEWGFVLPLRGLEKFTLAKMLNTRGYNTGYIGKWHLGTVMTTREGQLQNKKNVDYTRPLIHGPVQLGFDYSFILPASLDMYPYVFVRNNKFVGRVTKQRGWSAFNRIGPAEEDFEDYKVLGTITTEAERFIDRHAEDAINGKPFFLYFATTSPHTPTAPSPDFEGKSRLGLYGDFVEETDHCIGRVLSALKAHGLEGSTLVIVTSDHGPATYAGNTRVATVDNLKQLEKLGHHATDIYRGYKFSVYEGGLRVPYIVRWPGVVKPGTTCKRLIGLNDLIATLADVTGYEIADDEAPDSISFLPLLRDPTDPAPRRSIIMQSTLSFVVREGRWKLAVCPGSGAKGLWGQEPADTAWKRALAAFGRQPTRDQLAASPFVQLFDMEDDPREKHNLAARRPEIVKRLAVLLDADIARGRSTPGPALQNDARVNIHGRVPAFVLPRR